MESLSFGRGQSEVLGVILLLGFSTLVISTAVLFGGEAISDVSSTTQSENALNSISHVESEVSGVAIGESSNRQVDFSDTSEGIYYLKPDSGRVSITHTVGGVEEWGVTRDFGAVVYNGSDRDVAYQGGGVWMKQGNFTKVVSSPEYYYQDNTLIFPIIQLVEPGATSAGYRDVPSTTQLESGRLEYPLTEGVVEVTVQSPYYQGWHQFFTDRTQAESTIYHQNNTVVAELVVPDKVRLDNAVSIESKYDPKQTAKKDKNRVVLENELEDNVPHASADSLIDSEIAAAASSNDNGDLGCVDDSGVGSGCTLTAGVYHIGNDVSLSDGLTLDVSDGDIILAIDGDFDFNSERVSVSGDGENTVKYYIDGSLRGQGSGGITHATGGDATQNQLYVADSFLDDSSGGGTIDIEGVVYAPDADVATGGNFNIKGALVAYDLDINGNAGKIRRGDVPENFVLDVTGVDDTIEYLHITTNRVETTIEDNKGYFEPFSPRVDNGCSWVDSRIDGNDDLSMSGGIASCDVSQGLESTTVDGVNLDSESVLLGNIDVAGDVTIDTSHVTGGVTTTGDEIIVRGDSTVEGDIFAPSGTDVTILSGSIVEGDIAVHNGKVNIDQGTIHGDVYATESDVDCSDSDIGVDSESCSTYEFRDPSQY